MNRNTKYELTRKFGLCEVLSQIEAAAIGRTSNGQEVLMFIPWAKNKAYIPVRFVEDGRPLAATCIPEKCISDVRMLTPAERAEWLRISLELRSEWKAREAAEKEMELAPA
jgi:hypothetical protein